MYVCEGGGVVGIVLLITITVTAATEIQVTTISDSVAGEFQIISAVFKII